MSAAGPGGWTRHEGRAVALAFANIDTDQLIPARFLAAPRSEGYGRFLLHDLRRGADGNPIPGFPLDAVPDASILVAGRNFGAGSSREAAVYALVDAGFRAVLAPSFGDIFAANAVNNGLLPACLAHEAIEALVSRLPATLRIDLAAGTVETPAGPLAFDLDPVRRTKLANGWDDIDLTSAYRAEVAAFAAVDRTRRSWARPDSTLR